MTNERDQLAEALAALPTEPDEIARVFTELGIKGVAYAPDCCPVANYLEAETGLEDTGVDGDYAYTLDAAVPLPHHVIQFVIRFDSGLYPRLEATP